MASAAEQIKERLTIVDVVGSYIKLEGGGANFKAKCPFHNEKTPSFYVSPARGSYYCFGCAAKGDIFSFVQEYEKLDFLGALKILAERAGVELTEFKSEHRTREERQFKVMDLATSFFQKNLTPKAKEYLTSRGLTDESIATWRIGFAHDEWRSLLDYMTRQKVDGKQVSDEDLVDVGLIVKKAEQGEREKVYDRFRSRIMFPLFDSSGRVIAFSGRIFGKDEKEFGPKYLNSPDMELFNKSEVLYGFDRAKQGMREFGYAVLVEGQLDLLMSHQVGVKNAVATSGTALTPRHLEKIARMTKNLVFMYDSDKAGFNATRRGERLAIELGFDVKVVSLPTGEDPASLIQKDKQAFVQALKKSTQVIEYHLDMLLKLNQDKHQLLKAIEEHLVPDIALTPSAIRRSELISLVSLKSGIPEKAITEEVDKRIKLNEQDVKDGKEAKTPEYQLNAESASNLKKQGSVRVSRGNNALDITLRRTLATLFYLESVKGVDKVTIFNDKLHEILSESDRKAAEYLRENEREELLFEAEMLFGNAPNLEKHAQDLLFELEERCLKDELAQTMSELSLAEKAKDKVKSDEIIKKCQDISLKLSELNRKRQSHFKR